MKTLITSLLSLILFSHYVQAAAVSCSGLLNGNTDINYTSETTHVDDPVYKEALAMFNAGHPNYALPILEEAYSNQNISRIAASLLAQIYKNNKDYTKTITILLYIIKEFGHSEERFLELAHTFKILAQEVDPQFNKEVLETLVIANGHYPQSYLIHRALADAYIQAGEITKAIASLEAEFQLAPTEYHKVRGKALRRKGDLYLELRMRREAEQEYLRALEVRPNYPFALTSIAKLKIWDRDYKGALEYAEKTLDLNPGHKLAIIQKVRALVNLGRASEALEQIRLTRLNNIQLNFGQLEDRANRIHERSLRGDLDEQD